MGVGFGGESGRSSRSEAIAANSGLKPLGPGQSAAAASETALPGSPADRVMLVICVAAPVSDIWRAATLMLKRYGERAIEESTSRADGPRIGRR
jgi:hypothetical protein